MTRQPSETALDRTRRRLRLAECSQVDQCIGDQFEAQMPRLDTFKPKQQALELVFPCERSFNRES